MYYDLSHKSFEKVKKFYCIADYLSVVVKGPLKTYTAGLFEGRLTQPRTQAHFTTSVRNSSFDRATGDWYMWRSSSKTSFAVISVLKGKTWQST